MKEGENKLERKQSEAASLIEIHCTHYCDACTTPAPFFLNNTTDLQGNAKMPFTQGVQEDEYIPNCCNFILSDCYRLHIETRLTP